MPDSYLDLLAASLLPVLVSKLVDALSQAAEGGTGDVQEAVNLGLHSKALLYLVYKSCLACLQQLTQLANLQQHPG